MTVNVARMRKYNKGGRAVLLQNPPFPVIDWFTQKQVAGAQDVPEGAALRWAPGGAR